jgi:O-antigen/teichoic acid export membrane protein
LSVARHTSYSLAGSAAPVLVSLVTVPIYLKTIGFERYGVLSICWLLLGYFNLFDIGLGRATAHRIATLYDGRPEQRNAVLWTALALSAGLALLAVILFAPAAHIAMAYVESGEASGEIGQALPWLVAAVPLGICAGVLNGALEGRRAFLSLNAISTSGTTALAMAPLAVALLAGPKLAYLLAAAFVVRLITVGGLLAMCRVNVPLMRPRFIERREVHSLLTFGGWMTLSNIVNPLLAVGERFAIGALISAAAVAIYVVPLGLILQALILPSALSTALFPKLASSSVDDGRTLAETSIRVLALVLMPLCFVGLALVEPFLNLWLGASTASKSIPIAQILVVGFWMNSLARIAYTKLQATARPRLIALVHLGELLPYMVLLYVLMRVFGVAGAAIAWSLRCAADAALLYSVSGLRRDLLPPLAIQTLAIVGAVGAFLSFSHGSLMRWLVTLACLLIAFGALAFPSMQVRSVAELLRSVITSYRPPKAISDGGL